MFPSLLLVLAVFTSCCRAQTPPPTPFAISVTEGDQYTATQTVGVPDLIEQTAPQLVFSSASWYDGMAAAQIALPFPVYIYGSPRPSVYIGTNGNLQFGSQLSSTSWDYLPISTYDYYLQLPVFEPFYANLNIVNTGNVTWSLETITATNNRAILIRYTNITYAPDAAYAIDEAVSFDVLLYESPVGQIEVRYYRVDVDTSGEAVYQIGMQADEGLLGAGGEQEGAEENGWAATYFVLYDQLPIDATAQAALRNTTITFNFTGIIDSNSTCGGLGYDFSNISQSDISYWDAANSQIYYLRVCGPVTQPDCSLSLASQGYRAMACQANADSNGQVTDGEVALAVYNPNAIYWQYLANGVRATVQDGMMCSGSTGQPRVTILSFLCDPAAVNATITGYSESPTCTYNFNISTNIACGNGSRGITTGAVPSTLTSCQTITGTAYTATWCPRPLSSPAATTPPYLPNLVIPADLAADDGSTVISIGFNVALYGTNYSQLAIDSNGLITFGVDVTTEYLPGPFPDLGLSGGNYFPLVAPLWVDTDNTQWSGAPSANSGYIGYSLEGSSPNRALYVRWFNVPYYAASTFAVPDTATFDVIFWENTTDITTNYYSIAPNPSSYDSLVVGMHGQNLSTYTAVQNAPMLTVDVAARLSYSTITYSYTGPSDAAVCGAGLYPQLASVGDLNITSGLSRWWLAPCGVTTTSPCSSSGSLATQAASVCLSTAGTVSMLATDNPTATQWSVIDSSSVRSLTQDGAWSDSCSGLATVIVDYVCNPTASAAVISSVAVSGCTYNFVVSTSLLCAAAPPSYSSTSPSLSSSSASFSSSSTAPSALSSASTSSSAVNSLSSASSGSSASPSLSSAASSASSSAAVDSSSSAADASSGSPSSSSASPSPSPSSTASDSSSSAAASTAASSSSSPSTSASSSSSSSSSSSAMPSPSSASSIPASSSSSFSSSSLAPSSPSTTSSSSSTATSNAPTSQLTSTSTTTASSSSTAPPATDINSSNSASSSSSSLSGGAIAGIVIGSLAGVVLFGLVLALFVCRFGKGGGGKDGDHGMETTELSRPNTDTAAESENDVDLEMQTM